MTTLAERLDNEILPFVTKPARYIGRELNARVKNWADTSVRMVLAFPDTYEIGMSHIGLKILYQIVNDLPWALCERTFAPWTDMESKMRENFFPLFSQETHRPVAEFDLLGFTLQYEMSYATILNMLNLAGLPLKSDQRDSSHPLVVGGGPGAFNPEVLAEFFDFFVIGEGEEVLVEVLSEVKTWKEAGGDNKSRSELLRRLAQVEGVYVPSLYAVSYNSDGTVREVRPTAEGVPPVVKKRYVKDLNAAPYPTSPIVPYLETIHDRLAIEVMRGCPRRCRFCQANSLYRPSRERSFETVCELVKKGLAATGYEEVSLTSLSTSDYRHLTQVVEWITSQYQEQRVAISLPSMRIDSFSVRVAEKIKQTKKTGFTFAPEAGTERLRRVVNKPVSNDKLFSTLEEIFQCGWHLVKLYFMLGLPTETEADLVGIADTVRQASDLARKCHGGRGALHVSLSSFVPKAHTPFQWESMLTEDELDEKAHLVRDRIGRQRNVTLRWREAALAIWEGAFARGDRRLGRVIQLAQENGAKFDAWTSELKHHVWREAFRQAGLSPDVYARRERPISETLPWDHIDAGAPKELLLEEREAALGMKTCS